MAGRISNSEIVAFPESRPSLEATLVVLRFYNMIRTAPLFYAVLWNLIEPCLPNLGV